MAVNDGLRTTRCSFCGASESQVGTLVAGGRVHICETCVAFARQAVGDAGRLAGKESRVGDPLPCSFCDRLPHQAQRLVTGPGVRICDHCIRHCDEVLAGAD